MAADMNSHPHGQYAYLALTRKSAEGIAWSGLKEMNDAFGLGLRFHETKLRAEAPNGACITLHGADNPDWVERLLGRKHRIVAVDEAASFGPSLRRTIYEVLVPTTTDALGTVYLVGTPSHVLKGLFYDVTNGLEPGWSVHRWSTMDNPHMARQFQVEIDDYIQHHGAGVVNMPWFKRHYHGEWVVDDTDAVYRYERGRNSASRYIPTPTTQYILGLDLGYAADPCAFVVGAFDAETSPHFYVLESYRCAEMLVDAIADRCKDYASRYPGLRIIGDPAHRWVLEELRQRFDMSVEIAEKAFKDDWIEVINSDLYLGRVKLVDPDTANRTLAEELVALKWREMREGNTHRRKEDPRLRNDCCDALLYAYRAARHYLYTEPRPQPAPGTAAWFEVQADNLLQVEIDSAERRAGGSWWES